MKNFIKGKLATVVILIITLILAGVAIFTALRLYQLRQQAVAPTAPTSIPKAAENACSLSFTLSTSTPTPSGSPTPTPSETPTGTPTATPTGSPTPSATPNSCNGTCGSDSNCASGLSCYQGFCRNPSCPTETDCACPGTSAPTPTPTTPSLPESGTSWPTLVGSGIGILVILGSLLLAF
jgi:hypothetical protein